VEFDGLRVESDGAIGRITLDRPERRNALSLDLLVDLNSALHSFGDDCAVIILGAEGPAFSAGHDMRDLIDRPDSYYEELFSVSSEVMQAIHELPQPVIGKVQGVATAAGCQLVASCDLAVAAEDAWFATPGVSIGLFCSTPMVPVSRSIGRRRAMQMLLTGEPIDAATAVDWGLINAAVPAAELEGAVVDLAEKVARFSPAVIAVGKRAFYAQDDLHESEAYAAAKPVMAANAAAPAAQEGMSAFLEKREPEWPE
jgi:enoyl-CoA hydratase/carnithine racemase